VIKADTDLSDNKRLSVLTAQRARAAKWRIAEYRTAIPAAFLICALVAAWIAVSWPMSGRQIQASFFVSLVASSLTLFGVVFTLCLIGTQLVATRTKTGVTRVFGVITWMYLALFLITTLWTLEISYYAGEPKASPEICKAFPWGKQCMAQIQAGRISIFGLAWSLLFLLPFIFYIYWRLSPRFNFTLLIGATLRARNEKSLQERCHRVTEEILAVAFDFRAVAEGLSQLLELGWIGARRKSNKGSVAADHIAINVSRELDQLNYRLIQEVTVSKLVLEAYREWTLWLIRGTQHSRHTPAGIHSVPPGQVGRLARDAVKSSARNLRLWETASAEETCAREASNLIQGVVEACGTSNIPIRAKISEASIQLADCAIIKLAELSKGEFNLAFRSLIRICELTSRPRTWRLGGEATLRATTRTLKSLGESNDSRAQLSSWILDELHNLADSLSLAQSLDAVDLEIFLRALAILKDEEIKTILAGPGDAKLHKLRGKVTHSWEAIVLKELYDAGCISALVSSQPSAVGRCANDADLVGLIAILEQLEAEYISTSELQIESLLTGVLDNIASRFRKDYTNVYRELRESTQLPKPLS
jgi:hypothetical protein